MTIVGLPDTAITESRERVRAAIKNSAFQFPQTRITVNLAPADLRKEGPAYDLPIAIGLLVASEQMKVNTGECLFVGELSLDGGVRNTNGILPMASLAKERGFRSVFVPGHDAPEAALIPDLDIYPVESLNQIASHFAGGPRIEAFKHTEMPVDENVVYDGVDFQEVRGQEHVKRALEVAAGGGHNMLMAMPPSSGKTLMAWALPSILPQMSINDVLDVTRVYSVADLLRSGMPPVR